MLDFLKGGMFRGKRTYILGFLVAAQAVASFLVGDIGLNALLSQLPEILGGLGLMSLRASVD
jgi:hypothetical protein